LAAVVLVRRESVVVPRLINLLPADVPISELLEMNFRETRHFQRLIAKAFGEPMPTGWLKTWRERERNLLKARSQDTPFYQLDLPATSRPQKEAGRRLVDLMKAIL
jgi:hypothetical protein